MADKDEAKAESVASASVKDLRAKVADIDGRVSRLTDLYVEQDIDRDAYLLRKRALMSERKTAEGTDRGWNGTRLFGSNPCGSG